jgi:hypothetical protein
VTAAELIARLRQSGVAVAADGGHLKLRAGAEPTGEVKLLIEEVASRKEEVLAYLTFNVKRAGQLLVEVVGRLTDQLGGRAIPDMPAPVTSAYATMAAAHDARQYREFEQALTDFEAAWAEALKA